MRAFLGSLTLAASPLVLLLACGKDPYQPGSDQLGTFKVDAHLSANSCGPDNAPDPWTFNVKLSEDPGATLYWIQNDVPVSGKLDTKNHAALTSNANQTVASDDAGTVLCAIERDDSLDTTLTPDPNDPTGVTSFTGTLSYAFKQSDGLDCSAQLSTSGGSLAALPCTITYAITGTRTALPNKYGK